LVEIGDAFLGVLEGAQGFGFQSQMQVVAGLLGQLIEEIHAVPKLEQGAFLFVL